MEFSTKLKEIKPSPTGTLNAKTKNLKAQGRDIINFSIGEPDFDTPLHIKEAAKKAIDEGITRYTANEGLLSLREVICEKLKKENNLSYHPSQIVVSSGAKHSLYNIYQALLNPGDEVILQSPYWVSYPEMIRLAGGTPVIIKTDIQNQFKMNPQQIRESITTNTKVIHLNSPSNPTGSVYSKQELIEIGKIAEEYNLWIVSDEIYEKLIFDAEHISIGSLSEDLYSRTVTVNGVSKAYAMTGWRIGYTASSKEMAKIITSFQSHSTSNASSVSQMAAIAAISGPQTQLLEMLSVFKSRRDYMYRQLMQIEDTEIYIPQGSFYMFPKIDSWMNKLGVTSCVDVSEWLLEECGIASVPGAAFGSPGYLRFSFAVSEEEIKKGTSLILEKLNNLT